MKKTRNQKGITLVALIITIIVLLILAVVTIRAIQGDGIIAHAKNASDQYNQAQVAENGILTDYLTKIEENAPGVSGGGTEPVTPGEPQTITSTHLNKVLNTTANTKLVDRYGNNIVLPAGFKIVEHGVDNVEYNYSNDNIPCVQDGIVIQDNDGNQFVWVPVGKIKNNNETTNTITLGRYSNWEVDTNGNYIPSQNADNYTQVVSLNGLGSYQEFSTFREGKNNENATARNLKAFVENTQANHGYYIGRYEASYRSGTDKTDYIPYCKKSVTSSKDAWINTKNRLWNWINQVDAAAACRNMYNNSNYESDLTNSYAWDTAIIFIQIYSDTHNYGKTWISLPDLTNTGVTEDDKKCNIYNMASNASEWSTEYTDGEDSGENPYVFAWRSSEAGRCSR